MHHRIENFLDNTTQVYQNLLTRALRHRFLVLGCVLFLFLGSLGLTPFIGREFFPQVDAGQITIYLRCPSNMRLDATTRRVAEVEEFVKKAIPEHEREMIVTEIGLDPDWSAAYTANSGQQDAVVRVQLSEDRSKSSQEYASELRRLFEEDKQFADLRVSFDTGGMVSTALNNGASSPIDIQMTAARANKAWPWPRKSRTASRASRALSMPASCSASTPPICSSTSTARRRRQRACRRRK